MKSGYSMVELLVVISVIGILAAIGTVAYVGWHKSTIETQLKSDLKMAAAAMEDARNFGDKGYPVHASDVFKPSEGVNIGGGAYESVNKYTITAVGNNQSYSINQTGEIVEHISPIVFLDSSGIDHSSWSDVSGNGNHAIFNKNSTFEGHIPNYGLSLIYRTVFDGDYLAETPRIKPSNNMTWSVWLRRRSNNQKTNYFMSLGSQYPRFSFKDKGGPFIHPMIEDTVGGLKKSVVATLERISENKWDHLTYTREVNDGKTKYKIYKNGKCVNNPGVEFSGEPILFSSEKFIIGAGMGASEYSYYKGDISMVKIFNRTLTDAEIKYEYDISKHRFGNHHVDGYFEY